MVGERRQEERRQEEWATKESERDLEEVRAKEGRAPQVQDAAPSFIYCGVRCGGG